MQAMPTADSTEKRTMLVANALSIAIPLVVAVLLGIRTKVNLGTWTHVLPHAIGGINTLTSMLLVVGIICLKRGNITYHRYCMSTAFGLGACFLICYVTYHLSNPSTAFGGAGLIRYFYYTVLISHIACSLVVLPLVLRAFIFALTRQFERHRRIAKYAFPIWIYVSVTGVIAYLLIAPYYKFA
jgi:putative membrane protein